MVKISKKPLYTFEDWKKDYHSYPSIPSSFYDIPKNELDRIHQEQERLFWQRVEEMTERYKSEYQDKANTSGDLERLKKDEIEALTNLFYPDKVKVPILQNGEPNLIKGKRAIWGIGQINGAGLRRFREAYQIWVINGTRDYTYVKYNNRFNTFNDPPVAVIALKKYYEWLCNDSKPVTEYPITFEEVFYNPNDALPCLEILMELPSPVIDIGYNYIGKLKGVIPTWIKVLQTHKPEPLIKPIPETILKDLLNNKIKGLNLTQDASEFRKTYKRVETQGIELDIRAKLSQFSQNGKLGK